MDVETLGVLREARQVSHDITIWLQEVSCIRYVILIDLGHFDRNLKVSIIRIITFVVCGE